LSGYKNLKIVGIKENPSTLFMDEAYIQPRWKGMKLFKVFLTALLFWGLMKFSALAQDLSVQYFQAGNTYYSQKNYDLAIRYYQGAAQGNPKLWQAYQGMGNCYYAKGDTNNALTNYNKALSLNPNNPQLSQFVQSLQAKVGASPAATAVSSPTPSSPRNNGPQGAGQKIELDVMAGGDLILSASDPLPSNYEGVTIPSLAGGYGSGLGGGGGAYIPLGPNFLVGANAAFYTYGANYNFTLSILGANEGITETIKQSNIEILAAAKYRFNGNNIQPYLLGGVGFALVSFSSSVTEVTSGFGTPTASGYAVPSYTVFSPMLQAGGGVQFPMGNGMNFFAEGKLGIIFIGSSNHSVTISGTAYPYTSPASTLLEFPIDVGLNFNL
jgi:tetratricopeptide (TPR) repeat protein